MLLDLKIKTAIERRKSGYKVYQAEGDPEIVEAETVSEAIEKTSIKLPTKIEKIGIIKKSLFSESELEEITSEELANIEASENTVMVDDSAKYQETEQNTENLDAAADETNHQNADPSSLEADDNSNVDMSV